MRLTFTLDMHQRTWQKSLIIHVSSLHTNRFGSSLSVSHRFWGAESSISKSLTNYTVPFCRARENSKNVFVSLRGTSTRIGKCETTCAIWRDAHSALAKSCFSSASQNKNQHSSVQTITTGTLYFQWFFNTVKQMPLRFLFNFRSKATTF